MRIPPQSLDGEQALLGSIMLKPEAIHDILDVTKPESFYAQKHQIIWSGMMDLFSKRMPIDLLSLSTKLEEIGELEKIGGATYLTELVNMVPSAANISHYAGIVQKKYMMRRLIEASEKISHLGYDEASELEYLLEEAQKTVYDVTNVSSIHKFVAIGEELSDAWERIDMLHKTRDQLRGVPTGFRDLDSKLAGFQKSDLIILAARPSTGKTALALDMARNAASVHGVPVGIFSLEMSSQQLVDRMLASESRVDSWKIRTGHGLVEGDFDAIRDGLDSLSKAPIYIDDQPGNNILKMRSVARRLKNDKGLGLIVVDYLQLMVPTNSRATDSTVQQVTEISRSLKNLARELDVPVLALSQLSRAVEQRGGKPRLSDLRDSGSIEQDADVVMFIHREDRVSQDTPRTNIAEILIEKHRNGPTGKADLYFDDKRTTFMNMEKSEFGDVRSEVNNF